MALVLGSAVFGASPGLPFTEGFADQNLMDAAKTTANWSTAEQKVYLAWKKQMFGAFGVTTVGVDVTADAHPTYCVALGDMDGDGDCDLIAGTYNDAVNRLYLNNGTSDPFNGVTGSDITGDAHDTTSVALGDVDGDGDLDLVAGNAAGVYLRGTPWLVWRAPVCDHA